MPPALGLGTVTNHTTDMQPAHKGTEKTRNYHEVKNLSAAHRRHCTLPATNPPSHHLPGHRVPHSPPVEGSRSNDRDSDPLEEKAESTEDTPESLLPLLADGSLDSEALRLSSPGPSSVWEVPEPSCDSSSERLSSLSKAGAEARLRGVDTGACEDEQREPGEALAAAHAGGAGARGTWSPVPAQERNPRSRMHGARSPRAPCWARRAGRPGGEQPSDERPGRHFTALGPQRGQTEGRTGNGAQVCPPEQVSTGRKRGKWGAGAGSPDTAHDLWPLLGAVPGRGRGRPGYQTAWPSSFRGPPRAGSGEGGLRGPRALPKSSPF